MIYFFVLGNNPTLSLMELAVILPDHRAQLLGKDFLIWESEHELQPLTLIKKLGGVIKIGVIKESLPRDRDLQRPLFEILKKITQNSKLEGKFNFGLSNYGVKKMPTLSWGLELKKKLRAEGLNSRLVTSKDSSLSSVVVEQNNLLTKGCELVIISGGEKTFIGQTLAVQAFKELSKRDYGRPVRDDASGMLPPKLAQIMLNLAGVNESSGLVLDPFCGSGTVLQEALLLGAKEIIGTDVSRKAVADTKKNLAWLREKYNLEGVNVKVFLKNATKLSESFKPKQVAMIVSEPYLGPQRGWYNLNLVKEELESLYTEALNEFSKIIVPQGRVVMVWPSFFGNQLLKPDYGAFKIINFLPETWEKWSEIKLTPRKTVIYGRVGQKVFREIVILEKN